MAIIFIRNKNHYFHFLSFSKIEANVFINYSLKLTFFFSGREESSAHYKCLAHNCKFAKLLFYLALLINNE